MTLLDPYAPIEKVPLFTEDNMQSRNYSVRMFDPGKGEYNEVGTVGSRYLLVDNKTIKNVCDDTIDTSEMNWQEGKTLFNGKRYIHTVTTEDLAFEAVGDQVNFGLMFRNSYDGSTNASVQGFASILSCTNGMQHREFFNYSAFRHTDGNEDWEEQIRRNLDYIKMARGNLEQFANSLSGLKEKEVNPLTLADLRRDHLAKLPNNTWAKMMDRFLLNEPGQTGWDMMQAGTNISWHNEKGSMQDIKTNEFIVEQVLSWAIGSALTAYTAEVQKYHAE